MAASPLHRLELRAARLSLRGLQLTLGPYSPSEQAARYRLGWTPRPDWLDESTTDSRPGDVDRPS
ncbi:hypothetical protein AB2L28_02785 [Kineococcus sp. TBRC 1896]|uniref:Uncharacterized protein n=1 Tax=Kineococcus mangrovi TaxID=1660183 RepID=A0ABV4HXL2_9ACTN